MKPQINVLLVSIKLLGYKPIDGYMYEYRLFNVLAVF